MDVLKQLANGQKRVGLPKSVGEARDVTAVFFFRCLNVAHVLVLGPYSVGMCGKAWMICVQCGKCCWDRSERKRSARRGLRCTVKDRPLCYGVLL